MKLNLGCGLRPLEGYVNVDYYQHEGVDFVEDLNRLKWSWKDNSVKEIFASDILEHVNNPIHFLNECNRILQPRGIITIQVPHYKNPTAYMPQHKSYFSFQWFNLGLKEEWNGFKSFKIKKLYLSFYKNIFNFGIGGRLAVIIEIFFPVIGGITCELEKQR